MSMEWEDCAGHHEIEDQADLFRTARLSHDVVENWRDGGRAAPAGATARRRGNVARPYREFTHLA